MKVARLGILSGAVRDPAFDGIRQALPELGYVEGQNVVIESRFAEGQASRLPLLAADLVERKVDVVITITLSAALAAQKATSTIPIVFTVVSDPMGAGLVSSLARPGANITGTAELQAELTGKRFELFKQAVPSLRSLILLLGPPNPANSYLANSETVARRLQLESHVIEVQNPHELESTLIKSAAKPTEGIVLVPHPFLFTHRAEIAALAIKYRRPLLGWQSELANSGALMSYGANHFESGRHAAVYVAKILKGAKPAELPVEQASQFELVINLKTAKALGLKISDSLLARADRVIE